MSKYIYLFILIIISINLTINKAFAETEIHINIPSRTLEIINDKITAQTYPIGIGRPSFPTPVGDFNVISKIKNPIWENPYKRIGQSRIKAGKNNPLGTRWIGFYSNGKGEYGIHGTNNPNSVGKLSSHGCIRMIIKDAEKIFNEINIGTPVKISYYTHKIYVNNGKIKVIKFQNPYNKKINTQKMILEQLKNLNQTSKLNIETLKKIENLKNGEILTIGILENR